MRWFLLCLLPASFISAPVLADSLVANRLIKAGQIIEDGDLALVEAPIPGAIRAPGQALGLEARVTIYPGRPILPDSVGQPTVVSRNQIVTLAFVSSGLSIMTEGRALAAGATGDIIRVINLASRNTVLGRIMPDGTVRATASEG